MKYKIAYILIALVILAFVRIGLDFDGLYGQDSYEYLRFTKALKLFFETGKNPADYFWPVNYPLLGAVLNFIIPNSALTLQLISVVSLAITAIYVQKAIEMLYKKSDYILIYVLLLFVFSPTVFKMGTLVMSDSLSALFVTLCCYHSLKYYKLEQTGSFYFAAIFGITALITRYACFVILLPFACYLIYLMFKRKHLTHLVVLLPIAGLLLVPHLYFKSQNPVAFMNHVWLRDWSFLNFFKSSFNTVDGISENPLPNIIYAFSNVWHPRYCLFGTLLVAGFLLQRAKLKYRIVFTVSILLYAFFMAGIPFQNNRFALLSFPLLVIVFFPAFEWLLSKIKNLETQKIILVCAVVIQLALCFMAMKPVLERNKLERRIAFEVSEYQNSVLYSFDIDIALQGRGLQFEYRNLWLKEYDSFEKGALVLFNPEKFRKQWQDKNPMINWEKLNETHQLEKLKSLPDGWFLYQIQ